MPDKQIIIVVDSVYKKARIFFDSITDFKIIVVSSEESALAEAISERSPFAIVLGSKKYIGPLYEKMNPGGILARFGVGCDGINLKKTKSKKIIVTNTPGVLESTVAEATLFLAAESLRKFGMANEHTRGGNWMKFMGNDLHGKTWAVIGLGKIGKQLSKILAFGFGVKVYGLKKHIEDATELKKEYGVEKVFTDYAEIVTYADIVSLHLPATKDTHHFLNKDRLSQLVSGTLLINTGRGSLIDENALYDKLKDGSLSGAALDVFENEPYKPVNAEKDLRTLSNVILTPHISSSTIECAERMAQRVLQNIRFANEKNYNQMDIVSA